MYINNNVSIPEFVLIWHLEIIDDAVFIILVSFIMNDNGLIDSADINFDSVVDIFDLLLLSDFIQNM